MSEHEGDAVTRPARRWLGCAVLLAAVLAGCASLGGPGGLPNEVRLVREQYVADLARFDRDLEQYFTDDAVLTHGTHTYRGRDAIVKDYLIAMRPLAGVRFQSFKVTSSENQVVEEGRWNRDRRSAVSMSRNGRYTHVWVRGADHLWRLRSVTITDDL